MNSIRLTLPWPPTANNLFATVKTRQGELRRVLTGEGKNYRRAVQWIVKAANPKPILGKLGVRITAYPPDNRKRDVDNLLKAPLDALKTAGVYVDDSHIDDLHVTRAAVRKNGSIEVELFAIGSQPLPLPLQATSHQTEAAYAVYAL